MKIGGGGVFNDMRIISTFSGYIAYTYEQHNFMITTDGKVSYLVIMHPEMNVITVAQGSFEVMHRLLQDMNKSWTSGKKIYYIPEEQERIENEIANT